MYAAIILLLIAAAAALFLVGIHRRRTLLAVAGVAVAVATALFFGTLSFWGEALWFDALGYSGRFWTFVWARVLTLLASIAAATALTWILLVRLPRSQRLLRWGAMAVAAYFGLQWGVTGWDRALLYIYGVDTEVTDPVFGKTTSFYLFSLPLYQWAYQILFLAGVIAVAASVLSQFLAVDRDRLHVHLRRDLEQRPSGDYFSLYLSTAFLLLVLAWGRWIARYELMYSALGVVSGPGWTDANVRVPAYWVVLIVMIAAAVLLLIPAAQSAWIRLSQRFDLAPPFAGLAPALGTAAVVAAVWFVALAVAPGLFQWLRVQPNEITFERPYIAHNILFTREGFGLNDVVEVDFPASDRLTKEMIDQNRHLIRNVRLWDWRALDQVYKQFQEIRLYYEFADVDVDRYTFGGEYRQVMVSAREMQPRNLPQRSQTFVNRRFKYTHGYGITLAPVSRFLPNGLPDLLVKNIPPVSEHPELAVEVPQIYYGELTSTHVVANSEEEEFDYPLGDENVYIHYPGRGGVPLSNLWRKFLFGWKFDGTRFFLSDYPTPESRVLFHRQIVDRASTLAPFLRFDDDPYVVLAEGKLYWILDAYTTSENYPYSEPLYSAADPMQADGGVRTYGNMDRYGRVNYMRNSVKVVVDAFHGTTNFYVFNADDPLIQTWRKIVPALLRPREEMPEALVRHIRYPSDYLLAQGLVYMKYHMTDPSVFYNQEDAWNRATEKYYNRVQPVAPYYIIWERPDSDQPEFVLIMPFTPKNRQVLIGWIAGMCDPPNYGTLLAYQFPKQKRVLGTQQMETKIDQDRFLSGQLTLWDQRGSNVIRGNVLVIPIEDTLLYVEPIYLQAETAAYPELRLVAVMHNDQLSYAETFEEALEGLLGAAPPPLGAEDIPATATSVQQLIRQADSAFNSYLEHLGNREFDEAASALQQLQESLTALQGTIEPDEQQDVNSTQGDEP